MDFLRFGAVVVNPAMITDVELRVHAVLVNLVGRGTGKGICIELTGETADAAREYFTHYSVDVVTIYRCSQGQHEYGIGEERATCRHCGHFEDSLEDYSPAEEFTSAYPYNLGR